MRGQARLLLSISETTKKDAIRQLGVSTDRIIHTPLALPRDFHHLLRRIDGIKELAEMNIVQPYFLFVGRADPRKNLRRLLRAYARFVQETDYPHYLVVAGSLGTGGDRVLAEVELLGLNKRVTFLGYQPLPRIVALMKNAWAFVYPSLYEGFGLPLLEAMACGVPIVASGVSAIPEVAGKAAHYFDPKDTVDICRALVEITANESLRSSLIREGQVRLACFSWKETAQRTLRAYEQAIDLKT
jgi:glycosyltransferase involved in cell wall biosynthesis